MLFTTLTLRSRLVACAASMALASGLAAGPAHAGSKEKLWLQRGAAADQLPKTERNAGRPAVGKGSAHTRAAPSTWPVQPQAPALGGQPRKREQGGQPVARSIQPPQFRGAGNASRRDHRQVRAPAPPPLLADRGNNSGADRRHARPPAPPPPALADGRRNRHRAYTPPPPPKPTAGAWPRRGDSHGDDGRRRGDEKHYEHEHSRHETHVTHHHVQRHYYYRTSTRNYYYTISYPQPYPYPYPVYYLVPYHVHTTPGYHNHGEQTAYCADGYAQGGVYRGGAYSRGGSHQTSGAIIGSILGAAAGYQVGNGKGQLVAVGVGTVLGALIGGDVGRAMDLRDQAYATGSFGHAMEAVPSCTTITWNNPQTGNYGSVTPTHTYEPEPGRYCREFQQQVAIGGKLQDAYGTACRQPDGSWEIVAEQP